MTEMDAVIFDMDGVIFDSERLVFQCWEKIGKEYRLEGMREVFLSCIGTNSAMTRKIVLDRYGEDFPYEEFCAKSSRLFHGIVDREGLPVKTGVRELIGDLGKCGIPLALASSTGLAVVTRELKQAGLYEYFSVVMGGDQLKHSKPEPDIYLMTCERLGVRPAYSYAIEDSYNGIRSAYSAGMKPIMVPDMLPPTDEMRDKSEIILDSLLAVRDWLSAAR